MRKIVWFLLILVLACDSKKEEVKPTSLEGTWKQTGSSVTSCQDPGQNAPESACATCGTLVLKVGAAPDYINTYTWSIGSESGIWGGGGPITNATGTINFNPTGGALYILGYTLTSTTLVLIESNAPGALCETNYLFTRQ